jgi:hypothetical protein
VVEKLKANRPMLISLGPENIPNEGVRGTSCQNTTKPIVKAARANRTLNAVDMAQISAQ